MLLKQINILVVRLFVALALIVPINSARAEALTVPCGQTKCTVYTVQLSSDPLELMDRDDSGVRFGNASALEEWGRLRGKRLRFATNAGIFSWMFNPLGLFIKDGKEIVPLNSDNGAGNFYMKPNGVFYIENRRGHVVETSIYKPLGRVTLATQSGPLLLIDKVINSNFGNHSINQTIRSGVGVKDGSKAIFAISNGPINFYDFASFFKEAMSCTDALYLDGLISKMYIPEIGRNEKSGNFSALFAVFEEQDNNTQD